MAKAHTLQAKEEAERTVALEERSWDTEKSILQSDFDAFQQNKANFVEIPKLYKEASVQEYNQGYLDGYIGQDHREGWNSVRFLEEIRKDSLLVPLSLLTEAT